MPGSNSIIDPESGKYTAAGTGTHPAAQVSTQFDPDELPQHRPDRYANVDVNDFTNVSEMSVGQMATMADIAAGRGLDETALLWKGAAVRRQTQDAIEEQQAALQEQAQNTYVGQPGQILPVHEDSPWGTDPASQKARARLAKAQAAIGDDDLYNAEKAAEVVNASSEVAEAEADARQEAIDAGVWSDQDENQLLARQSLAEKAEQVAALFDAS